MMQTAIFWPVITMVGLTIFVGLRLAWLRVSGSLKKPGDPKHYNPRKKDEAPAATTNCSDHFKNLFEVPVLFYAICIVSYLTGNVDYWQLYLAWAFVGFRVMHSSIHLSYNNVLHRFAGFLLAMIALIAMTVRLAIGL
jgi:hypothetical protein